jgi:endonuclease YncB( thermonuclease family)
MLSQMKPFQKIGIATLLLLSAIALTNKISPQAMQQMLSPLGANELGESKHYQVVTGSIYNGDTLRVSDGEQEIKVRLCGIDAPEKDQALGVESRDHLRSLIEQGDGRIILVETDTDQYGRTVAEAFLPTGNDAEIHLNTQMVADSMAYVYPKYVGSCPNGSRVQVAEGEDRKQAVGVWANPTALKPFGPHGFTAQTKWGLFKKYWQRWHSLPRESHSGILAIERTVGMGDSLADWL